MRLIKSPVCATLVTYLFNYMFLSLWESAGLTGHVTSVDARIGLSMRAFLLQKQRNEPHDKGGDRFQ